MASLYQIEKLDKDNYCAWEVLMKSVLVHCDLWEYVSGETKLKEDATVEEKTKWDKSDSKALSTILLSVKPSELIHVKQSRSSKQAWDILASIHKPSGPARQVSLFKQLLSNKMHEGQSMSAHINNFCLTVEKLYEIDVKMPDELLAIMLLCSLPDDYENFIVAIESRDRLPTLASLKVKLTEEEQRRNDRDKEHVSSSSQHVLAIRAKSKLGPVQHSKKGNLDKKLNKRGKCFKCGVRGHFASQCTASMSNRNEAAFGIVSNTAYGNGVLGRNEWCIDSGATSHMCCDKNLFSSLEDAPRTPVELATDVCVTSSGVGTVRISTDDCDVTLRNVFFIPELRGNFLSVSKITASGHAVEFGRDFGIVRGQNNKVVLKAKKRQDLYVVCGVSHELAFSLRTQEMNPSSFNRWHERFGHLNGSSLKQLSTKNMVLGLKLGSENHLECVVCAKAKISEQPFPKKSLSRSKGILDLVHTDICGPMRTASAGGGSYFVSFIDDKSRKMYIYIIKRRNEVLGIFKQFKKDVERETGRAIKMIRSDNGAEYVSNQFSDFLRDNGIRRQLTVAHTPQQNGVAERANRTLVEMARCLLIGSSLPETLWAEAICTAAYLRNRCPTKVLGNKTPYEVWSGAKPSVSHFRVFGSKAVVLMKQPGKSKFEAKGKEYTFVGYSDESKAYRLLDMATGKIVKSRDVHFFENDKELSPNVYDFLDTDLDSLSQNVTESNEEHPMKAEKEELELSQQPTTSCSSVAPQTKNLPGRPKIVRTGKVGRPAKQFNQQVINAVQEGMSIPCSFTEAINHPENNLWREAMKAEFDALSLMGTWELVDPPDDCQIIGCRWVYSIKHNEDGSIDRYKCRLVAKGCSQKYMINYYETFAPVVRYSTIRLLIAMAAQFDLHLHHVDVTTAYLHGDLKETVFMHQPEGFVDPQFPNRVCRLKKSLYGLKQAGREWNRKLNDTMQKLSFRRCNGDTCVYTKCNGNVLCIVGIYVDDMIIAASNYEDLKSVKSLIGSEFDIVDKGELSYYLGIQIKRQGDQIEIHQQKYIKELTMKFNLLESKPRYTPLDPGMKLVKGNNSGGERIDSTKYQSLIGALLYIAVSTRPDIMYSVCKLSQFNVEPYTEHFVAAKHLLRYLMTTINAKLTYGSTPTKLTGYVDADWAGNIDDRRSNTGFVFLMGGGAVSWESKKQTSVALSSTEAEYMALSQASKEASYLRNLLNEFQYEKVSFKSILIHSDNLGAQQLVKNPVFHPRSKHIDIRYHFVRQLYEDGLIELKYTPTSEMIADIFTKNLTRTKHEKLSTLMGIKY